MRKRKQALYARCILHFFGSKRYVAHKSINGKNVSFHLKFFNVKLEVLK